MTHEIDWSDRPNVQLSRDRHDIVRCGTGSMKPHVILNDEIVGAELHWFQGRSTPHLKHDCPFCGPGKQTVWKGHVVGYDPDTKRTVIIEFTAPCIDPIAAYKQQWQTIRGALLRLHRLGGKANGKLVATVAPSNIPTAQLPEPFDLRAALHFMWNSRRDLTNIRTEAPRLVNDGPANNSELQKLHPERFKTNGHGVEEVYHASPEQLKMLEANRTAIANGAPRIRRRPA